MTYTAPGGTVPGLYADIAGQTHALIAGCTGSGKSAVINGIIYTILHNTPIHSRLILIDPKRVELVQYSRLPHTVAYATEVSDIITVLDRVIVTMESRYTIMQSHGCRKYSGTALYVIIDELADLMVQDRLEISPRLTRLLQLGRAAGIHIIAATQRPTTDIIDRKITCNIDCRLALHTQNAQDCRNIVCTAGAEKLPRHGGGIYLTPDHTPPIMVSVPMVAESDLIGICKYWQRQTTRI